jgi:hypothetical protein
MYHDAIDMLIREYVIEGIEIISEILSLLWHLFEDFFVEIIHRLYLGAMYVYRVGCI